MSSLTDEIDIRSILESMPNKILNRKFIVSKAMYYSISLYYKNSLLFQRFSTIKLNEITLLWKCDGFATGISLPIIPGSDNEKKLVSIFEKSDDIPYFEIISRGAYVPIEYIKYREEIEMKKAIEASSEVKQDTISPSVEFEDS